MPGTISILVGVGVGVVVSLLGDVWNLHVKKREIELKERARDLVEWFDKRHAQVMEEEEEDVVNEDGSNLVAEPKKKSYTAEDLDRASKDFETFAEATMKHMNVPTREEIASGRID